MNIKQGKEEIKNTVRACLLTDEYGKPLIPIEKQRPIFLIGAPGIGKTAIMEQVAQELGIGLVSYSMTHHTRQSALGLPYITEKNYGGQTYKVSEYTMSEIIASVYNMIEESHITKGILFLDEVNCVSETLAPSMLQFLQYKVFGGHRIPDGWIVVTAGNPPMYNNSVREFDVATLDRLKKIEITEDYGVWKEYALKKGIHPAITSYLDNNRDGSFYRIETTPNGKAFATARGWSDLSEMITIYEKLGIEVTTEFIRQYIQSTKIATQFSAYYSLFRKYKTKYNITNILEGKNDESLMNIVDERQDVQYAIVAMLNSALHEKCQAIHTEYTYIFQLKKEILNLRKMLPLLSNNMEESLDDVISSYKNDIDSRKRANSLSKEDEKTYNSVMKTMNEWLVRSRNGTLTFDDIKKEYEGIITKYSKKTPAVRDNFEHVFAFIEKYMGETNSCMLIFVTELTSDYFTSFFIGQYHVDSYAKYSASLRINERSLMIDKMLDDDMKIK